MIARDLRVPPDMPMENLIPFIQGIIYAEEFYGIGKMIQQEVQFETMESKKEEEE